MKTLARTRPVDFHISPFNKKQKSELSTKLYDFIPTTLSPTSRNNQFRSSIFYSKLMPLTTDNNDEMTNKQQAKSTSPDIISISSDEEDNDLDSILDRLQNLNFDTPSEKEEEEIEKKKAKLYELRKNILNIINEPSIDTTEFDDLFEKTKKLEIKEAVKPLTDQENKLVDSVLKKGQSGQVSQFKKVTVSYADIYRLDPEVWLNDEIVNFYFELLSERSAIKQDSPAEKNKFPTIHCFNTFFCSTLRDHGFAKVKRWTKRVDIFSKDLVFVPINQSYHWVLGVMDMIKKTVYVYDSLGGNHDATLSLFLSYLEQEHLDKKKTKLDTSDWKKETPKDIPQQENMSDCGAFTCTFAERLSRYESFNFSQKDMVNIRRRMVLNILIKAI